MRPWASSNASSTRLVCAGLKTPTFELLPWSVLFLASLLFGCAQSTELSGSTSGVTASVTLNADADTYVRGGSDSSQNYGGKAFMEVKDAGPTRERLTRRGLVSFDLSGLTGSVVSATLRLYVKQGADETQHQVFASVDFAENTVTWDTQPTLGAQLSSLALTAADTNTYVEFDVTPGVDLATGRASFAVLSESNTYVTYRTRESAQAPQLVIVTGAASAQPPATEPPTTEPVTPPPVTEPPATEPPATEPPATEPPATEPPVSEPAPEPLVGISFAQWKLQDPLKNQYQPAELVAGVSTEWFYGNPDGSYTFRTPSSCGACSAWGSFLRSELRETLRGNDTSISEQGITKNNWVPSSSTLANQNAAGGVDGTLSARLRIDEVTTSSGKSHMVGRVVIGQIHAGVGLPLRLYYRKLPQNTRGSVYFAFRRGPDDADNYVELLGSRGNSAPDPADGIALGEFFDYTIRLSGQTLTVRIDRAGQPPAVATVDYGTSWDDYWMYFKAGAYIGDNAAGSNQFAQVTFSGLTHTHP